MAAVLGDGTSFGWTDAVTPVNAVFVGFLAATDLNEEVRVTRYCRNFHDWSRRMKNNGQHVVNLEITFSLPIVKINANFYGYIKWDTRDKKSFGYLVSLISEIYSMCDIAPLRQ